LGALEAGVYAGPYDAAFNHDCAIKAPAKATGTSGTEYGDVEYALFARSGDQVYSNALGPCRTEDGGPGTIVENLPYSPAECMKRCDEMEGCVGFEVDAYTEKEKEIVVKNHAKGESIVANTCEIHTATLAFAQSKGVVAGTFDFSDNFQCFKKVSGKAEMKVRNTTPSKGTLSSREIQTAREDPELTTAGAGDVYSLGDPWV